jgi:hypothetical protein
VHADRWRQPRARSAERTAAQRGQRHSQHVNYIGTDNHVHELYIAPGQSWVDNDLTALA